MFENSENSENSETIFRLFENNARSFWLDLERKNECYFALELSDFRVVRP